MKNVISSFSVVVFVLALFTGNKVYGAHALTTIGQKRLEKLRNRSRAEKWTFEVGPNPALDEDLENLTGLVQPTDWKKGAVFMSPSLHTRELPAKFDWREEAGGLTPIKNQKSCGSCWAFGTVAALESIIKIRDKVTRNISEQQLVSCNTEGYGCNGGWFAHDLHQSPGAIYTSEFPYTATDSSCKKGVTYNEKILGWAYVGGSENHTPTVTELKAALMEYGPLAVTVSATGAMQGYTGGIFNSCGGKQINHLVNIVGWNDAEGVWIMRNSWGASWGEQGYMRIKYNCNMIGDTATFVKYKAPCEPQPLVFTGSDKITTANESVYLGGMPVPGQSYEWSPKTGLDDATSASPLANPSQTTTYTLKVTNSCGTASKSVTVTVN